MRKRQRTLDMHPGNVAPADPQAHPGQAPPVAEDAFINDHDAAESGGDDDDEDGEKPKSEKKAGRRKIKIEFIQDKSRRHITFSKRKAGIMKKAYELSTLTGTQVLLLVVSETGLVYTFTTAKLQPLVTQPEGKNLIQACLNAPHGSLPSSMPVGTPIGRTSGPMSMPGPGANNIPGGLSIGGAPAVTKEDEDEAEDEAAHAPRTGEKRRRRGSGTARGGGPSSPQSANAAPPAPLSIPPPAQHQHHQQQAAPPQIALGSPTSPQHQHQQVPPSPQYNSPTSAYGQQQHHQQHHGQQQSPTDPSLYGGHMMPPQYSYPGPPNGPGAQGGQQLGGLAAAAAQHGHWQPGPQPQVGQGYGRR